MLGVTTLLSLIIILLFHTSPLKVFTCIWFEWFHKSFTLYGEETHFHTATRAAVQILFLNCQAISEGNSFVSDRRQWYLEPLTPDKTHCILCTRARLKLDWLWHSQCHAQFPLQTQQFSLCGRVRTVSVYLMNVPTHFWLFCYGCQMQERWDFITLHQNNTQKRAKDWTTLQLCLSSSLSPGSWLLFWYSVLTNPPMLSLFMLTNHVWVIAHPRCSLRLPRSVPTPFCLLVRTPAGMKELGCGRWSLILSSSYLPEKQPCRSCATKRQTTDRMTVVSGPVANFLINKWLNAIIFTEQWFTFLPAVETTNLALLIHSIQWPFSESVTQMSQSNWSPKEIIEMWMEENMACS